MVVASPPMTVHLIAGLPAALVVVNPFAEDRSRVLVLVLVDTDQPWRRILVLSRAILYHDERRELCRALRQM
jgi:hypothetical protein